MINKCVLITGAAGGLGQKLAAQLESECERLILVDREISALDSLAQSLSFPEKASSYAANFLDLEETEKVFAEIASKHPDLDLAIANAGIDIPLDVDQLNWRSLDAHLKINTLSVAVMLSKLLPNMKKVDNPRFVYIASLAALKGFPYEASYCASKGATMKFIESLRAELSPQVNFTTIFPGFLKTEMVKGNAFKVNSTFEAQAAAEKIIKAIKAGKRNSYFPFSAYIQIQLSKFLPAWLADKVVFTAMKPRKEVFPE